MRPKSPSLRQTHLDRQDTHVDVDLTLPDLAEASHDDADVVEVLHGPRHALCDVINKGENLLHLALVLVVAQAAEEGHPGAALGHERDLKLLCGNLQVTWLVGVHP